MRDVALAVSGARVSMVSGQSDSFPVANILESGGGGWLSCGTFPQYFTVSLQEVSSISEIGIESLQVHNLSIQASVDLKPTNFQHITETSLSNTGGARQVETLFSTSTPFQARHVKLTILSGYHHFVAVFHVKIMGNANEGGALSPATFSAKQMGIKDFNENGERPASNRMQSSQERGKSNTRRSQFSANKEVRWGNDEEVIRPATGRDHYGQPVPNMSMGDDDPESGSPDPFTAAEQPEDASLGDPASLEQQPQGQVRYDPYSEVKPDPGNKENWDNDDADDGNSGFFFGNDDNQDGRADSDPDTTVRGFDDEPALASAQQNEVVDDADNSEDDDDKEIAELAGPDSDSVSQQEYDLRHRQSDLLQPFKASANSDEDEDDF